MGSKDPRVDAYIARSADFAKPILTHIRDVVHAACPGVVETIKWSIPHFECRGVLCSMASFRAHCTLGFRHAEMRAETEGPTATPALGQFGRIVKLGDLPRDVALKALVRKAAQLNESAIKSQRAVGPRGKKPMRDVKEET